jgi:hypothetical protein
MQTRLKKIRTGIENTEMVTTDDGDRIAAQYQDFVDVFIKLEAETILPHMPTDHAIYREPGNKLPYTRIYHLSESELKRFKTYIETNLASCFIQLSSFLAGAPILFTKNNHGGLRLCVDYRAHNWCTEKNSYPLPLISELSNRVPERRIFTKLDLWNPYHVIQINEGDEFETAIRTSYVQFYYHNTPCGLTNAPATFRACIDDCLRPYIDDFTVCYPDNMLIYSTNEK